MAKLTWPGGPERDSADDGGQEVLRDSVTRWRHPNHLLRGNPGGPYEDHGSKPSRRNQSGANRDRTDDLLLAKQALSQLSYGPEDGKDSHLSRSLVPGETLR